MKRSVVWVALAVMVTGCGSDPVVPASFCGDGTVDANEECDDGNSDPTDACDNSCILQGCGNARIDDDEMDDGNDANDDACTQRCVAALWRKDHARQCRASSGLVR